MFFYTLMIFIGGAFLLQMFLGYFQIRHFSRVFVRMRRQGRVAIGRRKGHLKSGTIVFLTVDSQGMILDAKKMQGVTILARFHSMENLVGESIQYIPKNKIEKYNKLIRLAIDDAINNYNTVVQGGTIQENQQSPIGNASVILKSLFRKARKTNI